jgi:hypothetical protein
MVRLWHVAAWPLVVKVPVLVAGLMVTVAVTTSQVVLWRFAQDQKSNLERLTGAYLDGLSAAVLPALVRRDARALFDALDHAQGDRYAGVEPRYAILELPNGLIIASSDPRRFPVQSAVPDELRGRFPAGRDELDTDPDTDRAWLARTLRTKEGHKVGRLFAEVDIAASLRGRREILFTLVLVNGCLTLAFALGGYFVLKRMLEAKYKGRGGSGFWAGAAGLMVILGFISLASPLYKHTFTYRQMLPADKSRQMAEVSRLPADKSTSLMDLDPGIFAGRRPWDPPEEGMRRVVLWYREIELNH